MEFPTGNRFYYFCNLYIDKQEPRASFRLLDYISIFLKRVQKCCTAKNTTVSSSPLSVSGSPSLNSKSPIPSMAQRFTMSLAISATRPPGTRSKSSSLVSIRFLSSKFYSYHKAGVCFLRDQGICHAHQERKENPLFSSPTRNTVCHSPIAACMNGSSYRAGMNGWTSPRRILTGSKTSLYSLIPRISQSPNSKSSKASVIDVERSPTSRRFSSSYCSCLPFFSVSL